MPWHPCFATQLPDLDAQHQYFVSLLDRLDVACQLDNGIQLELGLAELRRYAAYHFACEEALMRAYEYVGEAHRVAHRKIIERLDEILHQPATEHSRICLFVFDWLTNHIQRDDLELARHVLTRRRQLFETVDSLSAIGNAKTRLKITLRESSVSECDEQSAEV